MAKPEPLEVGTKAPEFSGPTHQGDIVSLSDFKGRTLVLYFYPKDDTPGCTKQACNLRDNLTELTNRQIAVVGVSPDDVDRHEKFTEKYELNFPLIADPEKEIATTYGVWGEKVNYGRKFLGISRTTYVIDADGTIVAVFKRPKVAEHTEEILKTLDSL